MLYLYIKFSCHRMAIRPESIYSDFSWLIVTCSCRRFSPVANFSEWSLLKCRNLRMNTRKKLFFWNLWELGLVVGAWPFHGLGAFVPVLAIVAKATFILVVVRIHWHIQVIAHLYRCASIHFTYALICIMRLDHCLN